MLFIPDYDGDWVQGNGYRKQILVKGDDLNQPGALIQKIIIAPEEKVPLHYHKATTEAFYVLKGQGIMTIDDRVFYLKPGDLLTCEPGERHDAENPHNQAFEYVVYKTNAVENDSYWVE